LATLDDVRSIAIELPGVEERSERGLSEWRVHDKLVAWQRPLRKADIAALGDDAPKGTILGVRVPDVGAQQALVRSDAPGVFITPHFENWPGVLVELEACPAEELRELIVEAWLVQAPKRIADDWLASND
jgi:hypothetical protein